MGRFGGKVVLAGTGRSVAQLLGTADGEIAMSMSGGRLSHLLVELAGIDAAEALPFLFDSDEPVELRCIVGVFVAKNGRLRSEEHTSALQSLMRISYDVFCLTKNKTKNQQQLR